MIGVNADCITSIYENGRSKVNSLFELLDENLLWLEEIQEEARKAFQSDSISLLPKTPGFKRKRTPLSSINGKPSPTKCSSTFVDESENKKIKIDDMSTIVETTDVSVVLLDDTQNTSTRSLRPRKKKSAARPVKKSKRINKQRASNLNKSLENKKSFFIVEETPSPIASNSTLDADQQSTVINETISKISPINHPVQPHVASIIEQLKKSTHKPSIKTSVSTPVNLLDDVKISLFGHAPDALHSSSPCFMQQNCTVDIEPISTPILAPILSQTPIISQIEDSEMTNVNDITDEDTVANTTVDVLETFAISEKKVSVKDAWISEDDEKDSGVSSDEKAPFDDPVEEKTSGETSRHEIDTSKDQSGRRDTYKVLVQQALSPGTSDMKGTLYDLQNMSTRQTSSPLSATGNPSFNLTKGPKIVKPVTSTLTKNIVSGVKTFLNRGTTPPRKTKEEQQQQKVADLEKKEQQRQKALEEANLRKQKLIEMKKKQRADREKRLADIHAKRQEEEERKRKDMEIRNNKSLKTREEIKRQREIEEKKKRELREMKNAIAEQRRQKEEELQQRKFQQQLEEEERRCEMMKRKMEFEEQERLKRKQLTEKEERERLRTLEKEKQLQEDRKIRELEEKDRHRQEVERKLKEDRDLEKFERQKQDQRLKQADKEIADANKKRELETSLAKNPILNIHKMKTQSPGTGKENNLVKAVYKSSPTFSKPTMKHVPFKAPLPLPLKLRESTYTSYDIDDLNSDDSTDDEAEPCKRIPSWAQGIELKTQLIYQFHNNVDPENIFTHCMEPCRLEKIFLKNKERYFKRTSSAHWDSPILKSKIYR